MRFKQKKSTPTSLVKSTPTSLLSEDGKKDSESISIEETNRIRVSLGLKPLK